eukprot:TRINITY_DN802_c0_g1_i1.p1 TRINITY_DN802_c0_g1~~TRINITY_DN802_c0_g1_i1.p1  ORF type:complete len:418 (-),score=103.11 TRINITY_DN802_c0_g1_i1:21-1274(-)
MKLYASAGDLKAQKVLIVARYSGVSIETPEFNAGDEKKPEFKSLGPLGRTPLLAVTGGSISEANAICRYVARLNPGSQLFGQNPLEAAQVEQWVDFAATEIELPAAVLLLPLEGKIAYEKAVAGQATSDIKSTISKLNAHLASRTYLVGEHISLADIAVYVALVELFAKAIDRNVRKPFSHAIRWFTNIGEQANVRAVLGAPQLCEVAQEPKAVVKEAPKPAAAPAKPAAAPATKGEPAPKPKPKDDDEEESYEDEPKKKGPNPLDLLPPPKIDMDSWKRLYSNNDKTEAINKLFTEHYAPEDYTYYFCSYNYNDECRVLFMTQNMIAGYIQRLEKLHKYGFGTMLVLGEAPKLKVVGCWMVRGNDMPAELKEVDDTSYYTWTKADPQNPADREKIIQYWTGNVPGEKVDEDWRVYK